MDFGTKMYRSILLKLAGNRLAEALALKYGLKLGAHKFVAGETLEGALAQVMLLNNKGITATLDHLGEGIRLIEEASTYKEAYLELMDGIISQKAKANISLKPTQMGIALDPQAAYANIRDIAAHAKALDIFVRIDMENSPYTDPTLDLVQRLHNEGLTNVGTVIQAYLYRSEADIQKLTKLQFNLRIVKGAYKEPNKIVYPHLADVDANFQRITAIRLQSGIYTGIATHDEKIIEWVCMYAKEHLIPMDRFEFQMLYGVRMQLQEQLALQGYRVRCYVPYGRMWYPYFVRRLAERPANVLFILKNMLRS